MRNDRSQAKLYKKHYKQDLPFSSWLEGFDIFIAIYVETAKSSTQYVQLTQELLTYKQIVSNFFKNNHDWNGYDRHFRLERENTSFPWSQLRPDLHPQYAVNSTKEQFRPARPLPARPPPPPPPPPKKKIIKNKKHPKLTPGLQQRYENQWRFHHPLQILHCFPHQSPAMWQGISMPL